MPVTNALLSRLQLNNNVVQILNIQPSGELYNQGGKPDRDFM